MKMERKLYVDRLWDAAGNGLVKIVTGMRRCGKSYLLFVLFRESLLEKGVAQDHILAVALDDRSNRSLRDPDKMLAYVKERITDDERYYILLDDIQRVKEFEDVLNSFLHIPNADVYVTVNHSHYLPAGKMAEFCERGDEIRIYPLRFAEFMESYEGRTYQGWDEYMTYGGLLQALGKEAGDDRAEYLMNLLFQIYLPDITQRYALRSRNELTEMVKMLATQLGEPTNPLKISDYFREQTGKTVSDKTAKKFLDYLEDSFLIKKSASYDVSAKKTIHSSSRYYFGDVGLRNAFFSFFELKEEPLIKNIIFNELCARGFQVDSGLVEIYEKNSAGKFVLKRMDVDYVAHKGNNRCYVQYVNDMSDGAALEQKKKALTQIYDSFPKFILVKEDINPRRDDTGIVTRGVLGFLSDETCCI